MWCCVRKIRRSNGIFSKPTSDCMVQNSVSFVHFISQTNERTEETSQHTEEAMYRNEIEVLCAHSGHGKSSKFYFSNETRD